MELSHDEEWSWPVIGSNSIKRKGSLSTPVQLLVRHLCQNIQPLVLLSMSTLPTPTLHRN